MSLCAGLCEQKESASVAMLAQERNCALTFILYPRFVQLSGMHGATQAPAGKESPRATAVRRRLI